VQPEDDDEVSKLNINMFVLMALTAWIQPVAGTALLLGGARANDAGKLTGKGR